MSCPHGEWHSEDCATCVAEDKLWRVEQQRDDLLEALEHMRRVFADIEGSYGQYEHDALDKADAAIAKAKGEKA